MWWLLLAACGPSEEEPAPVEDTERTAVNIEAVPTALAFGAPPLGTPALQTLSIYNHGEGAVVLSSITATSDDLVIDADVGLPIQAGAFATANVTWSPTAPATLDDSVQILVTSPEGGLTQLPVPATGVADGPVIAVALSGTDLGTVSVGCTAAVTASVTNTGTAPLEIDSIGFAEGVYFAVAGTDGEVPALPWTLEPGASQDVHLVYTPVDEASAADIFTVTSDDPFQPSVAFTVQGVGRIDEDNSVTYEVIPTQNVTALFAVNVIVVTDTRLPDAVTSFLDVLRAAHAPFRIAFLSEQDGEVVGDTPYVDDTMSAEDASAVIDEMLSRASGDNDYLLQTLQSGIEQNTDWLLDESNAWHDSRLSLIGMNRDQEQSSGNYMVYLLDYWTYKDDPADLVVDGIGGDVPGGCGGFAEPMEAFYDAANATGGDFLSICDADWNALFETLAHTALGAYQTYVLTGTPAAWSIEVWIDGRLSTAGWEYDEDSKQVVFDDEHRPEAGSTVRIDYVMETTCADAE
jgi:hypothetical protein